MLTVAAVAVGSFLTYRGMNTVRIVPISKAELDGSPRVDRIGL